ncbi:MAG: AAA family ATPase, partial [Gammaproteobacteria bacterium]
YMGDGMLVYFGYPAAHEDDATRAVRAGLDIVTALAELDAQLEQSAGIELAVRVGIATGPVIVGDIIGTGASEEAAVVGETPNLAARLQGVAAPGEVVISGTTHRLLGVAFDCDDLGARQLKGIETAVEVWRVTGSADTAIQPGTQEAATRPPLLGRDEELGLLHRAWASSESGHGQVVLVRGEAGIGKSRLLASLRACVDEPNERSFVIRCSPYHTNSALFPVVEGLRRAVGLSPEDDAGLGFDKLERALSSSSPTREHALVLLAELLSLELPDGRRVPAALEPQQRREQMLDALLSWLLELSQSRPTLVVWEDLHWADPTTLELLGLVVEQSPTASVLNVATFRPDFQPPWPMRSNITPITLNRMERTEVAALIEHFARGKSVPAPVVEHVASKADGVPLYVEELTKAILESDLLFEHADRFELSGSLADMHIPATLNDALMSRLDRLSTVRELIQIGAVLGREFSYELLSSITTMDEPALRSGLARLVAEELLFQRGRPPHARYVFKHALIQETAYESMLKRARKRYHAEVAAWLEAHDEATSRSQPEIIAHHLERAGHDEPAIAYWRRAGEKALERSANHEALHHLESALQYTERLPASADRDRSELETRIAFGLALIALRGIGADEVRQNYVRARALCSGIGNPAQHFSVVHGLSLAYLAAEDERDEAMAASQELIELAAGANDDGLLIEAHRAMGTAALKMGNLVLALEHFEAGVTLYDPARHRSLAITYSADPGLLCRAFSAWILCLQDEDDRAGVRMEEALSVAPDIGHAYSVALVLTFAAMLEQLRQNPTATRERAHQALEFAQRHGFALWEAWAGALEAWADAVIGTDGDALVRLRDGLVAWRAAGGEAMMSYRACLFAEAHGHRDVDAGLAELDGALAQVTEAGEDFYEPELHRLRGDLALRTSNPDVTRAIASLDRALGLARERGTKALERRAAQSLERARAAHPNAIAEPM